MSFQAMTWAIQQECGSAAGKLVLLMLANHANGHTGQCNPRHKTLAAECEMRVETLKEHIRKLEERGLLAVVPRFAEGIQLPNHYVLAMPDSEGGGGDFHPGGGGENRPPLPAKIAPGVGVKIAPPITRKDNLEMNLEIQPESPLAPQGGKRKREAFQAPTEAEWVEYCRTTWPEWHETCAAEAWAHYESAGWRMKAGPVRNWKAAAKTAHGNARNWGRLQPQAATAAAATRYGKPAPINHRERADAEYQRINPGPWAKPASTEQAAENRATFERFAREAQMQRDRVPVQPPSEEGGSALLRVPEANRAIAEAFSLR